MLIINNIWSGGTNMIFNEIYNKRYTCWENLENNIEIIESSKEKGDIFEQFAYLYFTYFSDIYQIEELFMGPNIPMKYKVNLKLERKDSGVDGIFIKENGSTVAYQVKFRRDQKAPSYDELTSFWAESEHANERCIFANAYVLPKQAYKKKDQFLILRDSLTSLDEDFFSWLYEFTKNDTYSRKPKRFSPYPHQEKMIKDVIEGFEKSDRGKLLAACGTGKTLAALWIKEKLKSQFTLFVTPNLALIKQTLESWMPQAAIPFSYLCVCSDETVAQISNDEDVFITDSSYIDVPVTTDPNKIREFITYFTEKDKVIFSTYHSLDAIVLAMQEVSDHVFDIAFFDEAHRTAGNKDSRMFIYGMENQYIPCQKRLYMTATERFVNPQIVGRAKQLNYEVFSMDNIDQYGNTFTALPFREAIEQGIISDYKIVLCCMNESEIERIIQDNQIIRIEDSEVDAKTIFKQVLLAKTMEDMDVRKVISYHHNISNAKEFIASKDGTNLLEIISSISDEIGYKDLYSNHINGTMSAGMRKSIFDLFIKASYGIISNVRCLTEGVDVPIIDAVYFADPKNSIIDIIQAVGRSLRKDYNNPDKVSYIIIPMIIAKNITNFNDIDPQEFSTLHSVIQALRDQDHILADHIDEINLRVARGRGNSVGSPENPIIVEIFETFEIDDFIENINLRIAEINKDPSNIIKEFIVTQGSRTSGVKRTFRTVGDYTIDAYYNNLVLPTLNKYTNLNNGLTRRAITIDHNNVSHCVKIGALDEKLNKFFVTDIGKALYEFRDLYVDIFKEQMLKYYELDPLTQTPNFPYRLILQVLAEIEHITRFEFVYSVYITKHFGVKGVDNAIERVQFLRDEYPNIEILNEANRRIVLDALNAKFETSLTFDDIWTTRTTAYNQFNYVKKHLLVWDNILDINSERNVIKLLPNGNQLIRAELDKSANIETSSLDTLRKSYTKYRAY